MESQTAHDFDDIEDLKPCVPMYNACTIRGLEPGATMLWCRCGLSKKRDGLWCDNSCDGTGFTPLKWIVPRTINFTDESSGAGRGGRWSMCNCKYTKTPPICDGTHTTLPLIYLKQIEDCTEDHKLVAKLCVKCGYVPCRPEEELRDHSDTKTELPGVAPVEPPSSRVAAVDNANMSRPPPVA